MIRVRVLSSVVIMLALVSAPALAQRGRGGRGRGAPPAPVPQTMQDVANHIVEMINNGDADGLSAMAAEDVVFLDEDGHAMPAGFMVTRLAGSPKQMTISGMQGQTWGNTGWVSFNFTMDETFQEQQVSLRGTTSLVLEQMGGDWKIHMVHTALEQHAQAFLGGN